MTVLVLGLARSGTAAARLLRRLGARVIVSDAGQEQEFGESVAQLRQLGVRVQMGGHPLKLLDGVQLLVKNPGIPYDRPIVQEALRRAIPVVTEVEVAGGIARAPILGITGSNGKTTTTSLVAEMLRLAGIPAQTAGNIGTPLSAVALDAADDSWLVTELSSFQLAGTERFRPRIAGLLNIYPSHLDYHGTMDDYIAAKWKIFANQTEQDVAVLNADHPLTARTAGLRARVWHVSLCQPVKRGVYVDGAALVFQPGERESSRRIAALEDVALRGRHNLENAAMASALALAAGAAQEAVAEALATFRGVEHRMEYVRTVDGVRFFNDSKATNPTAAIQALRSFDEPVVVILGGLERGDDLNALSSVLAGRARAVVALGQSALRMLAAAQDAGVAHAVRAKTLEEAVAAARALAVSGDVVLLSPAAASWDMFRSYEERGRIFKETVHML